MEAENAYENKEIRGFGQFLSKYRGQCILRSCQIKIVFAMSKRLISFFFYIKMISDGDESLYFLLLTPMHAVQQLA